MDFFVVPEYLDELPPGTAVLGGQYYTEHDQRVMPMNSAPEPKYKEVRQDILDFLTSKFMTPLDLSVRRDGYSYKGIVDVDSTLYSYELSSLGFNLEKAQDQDIAKELFVKYKDQEQQEDLQYARVSKALPREKPPEPVKYPEPTGATKQQAGETGKVRSTYPDEAGKKRVERAKNGETPAKPPANQTPDQAKLSRTTEQAGEALPPPEQQPVKVQPAEDQPVDINHFVDQFKISPDVLQKIVAKFNTPEKGEKAFVEFMQSQLHEAIEKHRLPTSYFHQLWTALTQSSPDMQKAERHHKAYTRRDPRTGKIEQIKAKGAPPPSLGASWWQDHGFRENPGWDGSFTNTHAGDPERYNSEGATRASKHLLRMRSMRLAKALPVKTLEACALFAITSVKVPTAAHEKHWPNVAKWLQEAPGDMAKLLETIRPLGMYNTRIKAYKDFQAFLPVFVDALNRFPEDGRALRRHLMQSKEAKRLGVQCTKISFILELLGYHVACLDSRVLQHLTGLPPGGAIDKIRAKASVRPDLYEKFEDALQHSAAYKESDPSEIRLGVAQWRTWNAQGGDDADHAVFWKSVAKLTGVEEFAKAFTEKQDLLSALMEASCMHFGCDSPVVFDGGPAVLY